jgi:hypothetical protein
MSEDSSKCELCERIGVVLTKHHLIPRSCHKNKRIKKRYSQNELNAGIMICRPCHDCVHGLFTEKTLAESYNTLESLSGDNEVKKFLEFIQKKEPSYKPKRKSSNNKR